MAHVTISVEKLKLKLYQKSCDYHSFIESNDETLAIISKAIYQNDEKFGTFLNHQGSRFQRYIDTLSYLTKTQVQIKYTFDQRIIFLILSVDPELNALRIFIKTKIPSLQSIEQQPKKLQKSLLEQRKSIIANMQETIRKCLGFYDSELIKYERDFYQNFLKKEKRRTLK